MTNDEIKLICQGLAKLIELAGMNEYERLSHINTCHKDIFNLRKKLLNVGKKT